MSFEFDSYYSLRLSMYWGILLIKKKSCFSASSVTIEATERMEGRHLLSFCWIIFLLMNGINGQDYVDNVLDIENEITDQPDIEQNVTECSDSVQHFFGCHDERGLKIEAIEGQLAQKDQQISQLANMVTQLANTVNELQVRIRISKTIVKVN